MKYPVIVGYDFDEVTRDEYRPTEARSPDEAARKALEDSFRRGERYDPGTYTVTVLVDDEPKAFDVVAEPVIECYLA